jgi:hypothetical protein
VPSSWGDARVPRDMSSAPQRLGVDQRGGFPMTAYAAPAARIANCCARGAWT